MKEDKFNSFNLSNDQNLSFPICQEKMKKSKMLQHKTIRKININHKKISKEKNKKIKKKFYDLYTINIQLQKYNSNPLKKNIMIINDILNTKTNHFLAKFKDSLITDYIDEFLKRYFNINECKDLIPKFYTYYQNYLKFFCRGFFTDFQINKIMIDYGENQAELYYNKNYEIKDKKEKKNKNDNSNKNVSNSNSSSLNKKELLFTDKIRNSINRMENSLLMYNYKYKFNKNEISNICYKNKNETITLNDDTKIYNTDNLISKDNSIIIIIDAMIKKKREKKQSCKNIKNMNNDKNILNIYKMLLNQSPIKSARNLNYNRKTTNKVPAINIFNRNVPLVRNSKNHPTNKNNKIKDIIKTPSILGIHKILFKNFQSRNLKINNNSNVVMKNNLTQRGYYRNPSRSISSRLGGVGRNLALTKRTDKKLLSYNIKTNLNINNQKSKPKNFNGVKSRNGDSVILSISSSRNLKKNSYEISYLNKKNNTNTNNKINNNRIKHYQFIKNKNKNLLKYKKNYNNYKQNSLTTNSDSILNNYHININNNIMLFNNNNNITNYSYSKKYLKSNSKKKKNENIKLTLNKPNKSRNIGNGFGTDLKKFKTEIKNVSISKSKKNLSSSIRKYIYLVKCKNKSKDKINKNKEILLRNKSNIYNNHSCFRLKKLEDSDIMSSFKNTKKLNHSNKNMNLNKTNKNNIIFDYKRKK